MKLFIKSLIITFIVAIIIFLPVLAKTKPKLDCNFFDDWFLSDSATRFDYKVTNGVSNLPSDAEIISTATIRDTGMWIYDSPSSKAKFYIVFLSFEPSGDPLGQHDICVYKLDDLN